MLRLLASSLLLVSAAIAASPASLLPPVREWHGASESLIVAADHPWITPSEKSGLTDSPDYAATVAYLEKLCAASPWLTLQTFGRTAQGRDLPVVIATKAAKGEPAAVRADGKPIFLIQAGIHSGEIDGKDAGLMLLRDLAFGGKDALLDRAHVLFVPILNADGHERISEWNRPNQRGPVHQGWRTTAQNLNLNRDYMKVDSPELRALLGLINTWQPTLYFDIHVTDGIDHQYDITYVYNGTDGAATWSPRSAAWLDTVFRPAVLQALEAQGHVPLHRYIDAVDARDFTQGLSSGHASARLSHGYGDLRHLPTVLVETHSLKPYRQRVLGTYVLLAATLELLGRAGAALQAAVSADASARPSPLALNWGPSKEKSFLDFRGIEFETYDSPASGGKEIRWTGRPKLYPRVPLFTNQPVLARPRPRAYWVPLTKADVIARLQWHGIQAETLATARTLPLEMYRLAEPRFRPGDAQPFEGRHLLSVTVAAEKRTETFPAGSLRVSTDQPLGDLAIALLEPESQDSFVAWGFFPEILQRTEYIEGYVVAPLAEQMLAASPSLRAEFAARLAADPAFAADAGARLKWFYERSPFYDRRYLLYPVGIER